MYIGWIFIPEESNIKKLEDAGVVLGEYNAETRYYEDCFVSEETLTKIEPLWGEYVWGLEKVTIH